MDFDFSEEQSMLASSCERLVRERCGFEARRALLKTDPATRPALWKDLCELGVTALCVPEDAGGLGRPLIDGALVAQTLGRGWLLEPFIDSALAAAMTLAGAPASSARAEWLEGIASGERIVVPLADAQAQGARTRGLAAHASYADGVLVLVDGKLLLAPAKATKRRNYRQFDGSAAAEVEFAAADAIVLGSGDVAQAAWQAGRTAARVGRFAEGVGLSRTVLDSTAEYLRTRKQFGRTLSEQQVLQHRVAEHYRAWNSARHLVRHALADWEAVQPKERERRVSAAKYMTGTAGRSIALDVLQLHGAIGLQEETAISHYSKRLIGNDLLLGHAATHLGRFAAVDAV